MRRLPVSAVPFLTASLLAVPLLAVTGCGGDPLVRAEPSSSTTYAPATPPVSSPTPSPSPTPPCVPTAGMDDAQRLGYLKNLKHEDRPQDPALFILDDGIMIFPADEDRSCEPVPVKVSHFWVETTRVRVEPSPASTRPTLPPLTGGLGARPTAEPDRYAFEYAPINTVTVGVGPAEGFAHGGSEPPAAKKCSGTLSVVYVGEEITTADLPEELSFSSGGAVSLDWTSVDIDTDRALDAVFVPPTDPKSC
ncbi:hypothetical protein [Streptomyces sp. NPDC057939]|uniref:hypothetical protein n=1 Tax=Streptomyces sp. NPDC057939 TaxID=3346284 RepID=UPI0036E270A9